MGRKDKRRCDYEGCRAWARRDSAWCVAHPEGQARSVGGAPEGNQNARIHGAYATYIPVVGLQEALQLPPGDLRLEIAVVRQVLAGVLTSAVDPIDLVEAVDKATGALVRMLKANRVLSSEADGELETAVEQYLRELGLGGG